MPIRACLIAATAIAALAMPAAAQMISPMLYHGPQISLRDHVNAGRGSAPARQRSAPTPKRGTPAPQAPSQSRPQVSAASLNFRPDAARRTANLRNFAQRTGRPEIDGRLFAQLEQAAGGYGLRMDSLPDAYAIWWINAWEATQGRNTSPSRARVAAVKRQATAAMLETPGLAGAGDAMKQEMAESLWIQAVLLDVAVDQSKGQPDRLRAVGDAAAQGARAMGVDLSTMTLTDAGFVGS